MTQRGRRFWLAVLLVIGILPFELNGWYNPLLPRQWFWWVEIFTWLVMPAAIVLVAIRANLVSVSELGFHFRIRRRQSEPLLVITAIIAAIGFYHLDRWAVSEADTLFSINYLFRPFLYNDVIPLPGPSTGLLRLLTLCYMAGSAGVVEELYYRGMMSKLFPAGWVGGIAFVMVSSVVFASVHWQGGVRRMFETVVWGIAAGTIFRLTSNLWPLIVAHVIVDFLWFM